MGKKDHHQVINYINLFERNEDSKIALNLWQCPFPRLIIMARKIKKENHYIDIILSFGYKKTIVLF